MILRGLFRIKSHHLHHNIQNPHPIHHHRIMLIFIFSAVLVAIADAKEIDSKTDLQQEESAQMPSEHRNYMPPGTAVGPHGPPGMQPGGPNQMAAAEPYADASWPMGRADMPQIKALNVKCEKNHMKVNIEFDRPFYGMIFSKGHYSDPKCVHLPPGTGHLIANFDIFLGTCGMSSSEGATSYGGGGPPQTGLFIENTLIVQYDAQVQEIWDQARRLRCTWYDHYEKAVTFRPFNVDMLDAVTANFLGDNIQCWMQIQVGKGPWASEVAGIVKIGQTMTMVLAIKDEENKFDMMVRNCIAHDGKHQPIQLVDEFGCVTRPKIMSRFQKVKNFGHSASVVSYAYFQAFKFPDSMNVHFQCVIQVCRYECPEPQACDHDPGSEYHPGNQPLPRDPSIGYSGTENKPTFVAPPPPVPPNPTPTNKVRQPPSSSPVPVYIKPVGTVNSVGSAVVQPGQITTKFFANRHGEVAPPANYSGIKSRAPTPPAPLSKTHNRFTATTSSNTPLGFTLMRTGGMPRSLDLNSNTRLRKKRQNFGGMSTDIETRKIIQVVAPGDVAFSLPTGDGSSANSTHFDDIFASRVTYDNSICLSVAGFTAGCVFLLLLLILSISVSVFFFLKLRHFSTTMAIKCHETDIITYENATDYYPTLAAISLPHPIG